MKFTIPRDEFTAALAGIARSGASDEGTAGLVLITVERGRLVLVASDGTVTIRREIPVPGATDGAACLPIRVMKDMVPALPDEPVHVENDGATTLIRCGRSKWNIASVPSASFPAFPRPTGAVRATMQADDLARLLTTVRYATVARSEANACFTAVCLDFLGATAVAVATDQHRLAKHEEPCVSEVFTALLPGDAAGDLATRLREDVAVEIRFNGGMLSASWEGWEFSTGVIGTPYPLWQRLVAPQWP